MRPQQHRQHENKGCRLLGQLSMALGIHPLEASERLYMKAKIAATPMDGWGDTATRYLRFVFSNEPERRLIGIGEKIKFPFSIR